MMALRGPKTGEFLGGQETSLGLLRRGQEGRLHVEVGSGRVWVVEELQMCGGGVECGREESEGEELSVGEEGVRGRSVWGGGVRKESTV